MRLRSLSLILFIGVLFAWHPAKAEEEGGGEKPKGEGAAPQPKDEREFMEKTSRLNLLASRIEEGERQFEEVVKKKAEEKNPNEKQRWIKDMNDITAERNKAVIEYNKLKGEIELRYPNRGLHLDRNYRTQTKKSLEEMEGAAGLDELLTRTKKIIEKKFAPFNQDEKEVKKAKVEPVADDDKPKPLRLEK